MARKLNLVKIIIQMKNTLINSGVVAEIVDFLMENPIVTPEIGLLMNPIYRKNTENTQMKLQKL